MNKRERNRLRTRAWDRLCQEGRTEEAQAAWSRAWTSRRADVLVKDQERARLAMLAAIDEGKTLGEAEQVARDELSREEVSA